MHVSTSVVLRTVLTVIKYIPMKHPIHLLGLGHGLGGAVNLHVLAQPTCLGFCARDDGRRVHQDLSRPAGHRRKAGHSGMAEVHATLGRRQSQAKVLAGADDLRM